MASTRSERLLSDTISWLRFPLMVGIVYLHHNVTGGVQKHGMQFVDAAPSWLAAFITFFSDVLVRVAIPLFFIMSGFLFFYYCDFSKSTYINKLKRRTSSLLLPYISWNVITTILALVALLPFGAKQVSSEQSIDISDLNYTISGFFNQFWDVTKGLFLVPYSGVDGIFPANGVLWYVRDLLILAVFSPVIYWLLKRAGYYLVYTLGLAWVILEPVNLGHMSQLLSGLFFFSWGGVKGINKINFVEQYKQYKWIPVIYFVIAIFDAFTKDFSFSPYIHELVCLVGIVAIVNISARLMEKNIVKVHPLLSGSSFIILAMHSRVKGYLSFFMIKIMCINSPIYLLIYYIVIPLATVAICVCIYAFIKKFTPFLLKPLTGGR